MSQQNTFIRTNATNILRIKRRLIESEYLPEYNNFPIREIQRILNGYEAEVRRLQGEVNILKNKIETTKPNDG